jgi:FkbM family methyltransferase
MFRIFKCGAVVLTGLALYLFTLQRPYALAMLTKAGGGDEPCPWGKLVHYPWSMRRMVDLSKVTSAGLFSIGYDPSLDIELIQTPLRAFWIKKSGSEPGISFLAFVLAEQEWISREEPGHGVRPGDVVVDVGAHVGTFGDDALRRGASKVIMVEPDPVNVECIRRNFKNEIASGRVLVIPEGAWSKTDAMDFGIGVVNSGTGSLVMTEQKMAKIKIPVRPLDEMLKLANVAKVDFIKMDIEGAEREALKGAAGTLRRYKPRIMLDSYHLPDDDVVLPRVIYEINPSYRSTASACSPARYEGDRRIIPYAVFYE